MIFETNPNPNANAIGNGIDVDESVAKRARLNMARWGLADRFRILSGDVRIPPEPLKGPFDLITLLNLSH
jgi:hypothetical protein